MQIIISNKPKKPLVSLATRRFLLLAAFSAGIIIVMFLMLNYYSAKTSDDAAAPAATRAIDETADNQAAIPTENIFSVVSEQQEEAREYQSRTIRVGFRRTAKTEKTQQQDEEEPILPPKSPDGALY